MAKNMNLGDFFVLVDLQQVRLHSEVKHWPSTDAVIQANVELKLSPKERLNETDGAVFCLVADIILNGQTQGADAASSEEVFTIELKALARYRQFQGEALTFEAFCEHHPSLARQLYPVLQTHLMNQLRVAGFGHVHLPMDLAHASTDWAGQSHGPMGHQVH